MVALACLALLPSEAGAQVPITLYQSTAGNVSFTGTGNTLRTQPDTVDPCAVTNTSNAALAGIPAGATIRGAHLYWAGSGTVVDANVTFQGNPIVASRTFTEVFTLGGTNYDYFAGYADVTALVPGNGVYTFADLTVHTGAPHCGSSAVLSGWSMIVVYEHPAEDFRVINHYDGFRFYRGSQITLIGSNFQVPAAPVNGLHGHLSWEGDVGNSAPLNGFNEQLSFQGNPLTDALNPLNNQFNSTVNTIGATNVYGVDVDIYDISPYLVPGQTSATTQYSSGQDLVLLSAEIFSVTNVAVADLTVAKTHTGDFAVGANEVFTLTVSSNGPSLENGPVVVTDTLPAGLTFVSGTGTGWVCGAVGQDVTCTHPGPLASGASLPAITLTVAVGAAAVPSVSNTACVAGAEFDNQAANDCDTDVVTVRQPDLSTSTKTVLDVDGGDADPGDVLRYTITLLETGGIDAAGVQVTDDIPADTTGFTVVSIPAGATDASTGPGTGANGTGFLDVTGITVPANGSVTVVFDVTIAPATPPGTLISNTATVINPGGPGATPVAPDVTVSAGSIPGAGVKPLYLYGDTGATAYDLSRTPPPGAESLVNLTELESETWTQTPTTAAPLTLNAGIIPVQLYLEERGPGSSRTVQVDLDYIGPVAGAIGSVVQTQNLPNAGPGLFTFNIPLAAPLVLAPGSAITLTVTNLTTGSGNRRVRVYPNPGGNNSRVELNAGTIINVDAVDAYDAAFPGGVIPPSFALGATAFVRADVSDPFGSFDITGASLDILDPLGAPVVTGAAMTEVFDSGAANKIYEYAFAIPAGGPGGTWTARVTAAEGTEGTLTDLGIGTFAVGAPDIVLMKTVLTIDDPVNGVTNPKAIPGANVLYTVRATNQGTGAVDLDTVLVSDPLPAELELFVNDLGAPGSGPVGFVDGAPVSGLTYTFGGLGDPGDDVEFDDGGGTFTYTPIPDANGYDTNVVAIRVNPKGVLNGSGGGNPSFELRFRARVR